LKKTEKVAEIVVAKSFIRCIICFMKGKCTFCYAIQAAISLNLLLLRRLPPRLMTQDVAAGQAQ